MAKRLSLFFIDMKYIKKAFILEVSLIECMYDLRCWISFPSDKILLPSRKMKVHSIRASIEVRIRSVSHELMCYECIVQMQ